MLLFRAWEVPKHFSRWSTTLRYVQQRITKFVARFLKFRKKHYLDSKILKKYKDVLYYHEKSQLNITYIQDYKKKKSDI
jgi:hypothetical protein